MKNYFILATALLLMTACSKDSSENSPENNAPVPILLGTSLEVNTRSNSQTLQATELADGTSVGVYIYHNGTTTSASTSYGYKNLAYTAGNATGDLTLVTASDQPFFPQDKTKTIDIYAFAPRTGVYTSTAELSTLTAENAFTTTADQTTDANYRASDYVWGKAATVTYATATTSSITIPLKHKLSKVNINIAPGTGMTLTQLAHARIALNGVILNGTVNFTTGAVTTSGTTTSSVILTSSASTSATTTFTSGTTNYTACTSSAVIIPQTIAASNSFITVELWNGSSYTAPFNVTTTSTTTFAAEKVYTYNIIVNSQGLTLTTNIDNWTSAGSAINGTAE